MVAASAGDATLSTSLLSSTLRAATVQTETEALVFKRRKFGVRKRVRKRSGEVYSSRRRQMRLRADTATT